VLDVRHISKSFTRRHGMRRETVHAVRDISFSVIGGETLGIVGESGCGKSTLGRCLVGAHAPTAGEVVLDGKPVFGPHGWSRRALARRIQMVFQDPYASLNPRMTVGAAIAEVLQVHRLCRGGAEMAARVDSLMDMVGLAPAMKTRLPHEFSGGQRQRLSIARALAAEPVIIVADEPVSALDVSIQAQILNLFGTLRERLGLTYVFISHDLNVVRYMSNWIAVLYLGELMELAPADQLFNVPRHPYTCALLSAVPEPDPSRRSATVALEGELPDPAHPPSGCGFRTRCPMARERCATEVPILRSLEGGTSVRCHFV
jgi:oligopeptide transport system ATP-binding protein